MIAAMRAHAARAVARGELKTDALVRFPAIDRRAGLVAIIWSGLFDASSRSTCAR